jgi:hypothetical protein
MLNLLYTRRHPFDPEIPKKVSLNLFYGEIYFTDHHELTFFSKNLYDSYPKMPYLKILRLWFCFWIPNYQTKVLLDLFYDGIRRKKILISSFLVRILWTVIFEILSIPLVLGPQII